MTAWHRCPPPEKTAPLCQLCRDHPAGPSASPPLVLESGAVPSATAAVVGDADLPHERGEGPAEHELAAPSPHGFRAHPGQEQTGQRAVGQLVSDSGDHPERVRPVAPDELFPLPWIGARQAAQREQTRHEPDISLCLARADELRHLVEAGEVVPRLWRGRRQSATVGQLDIGGHVAEENEPVSFTRHRLLSHVSSNKVSGSATATLTSPVTVSFSVRLHTTDDAQDFLARCFSGSKPLVRLILTSLCRRDDAPECCDYLSVPCVRMFA